MIVNADSMQLYKNLRLVSARPSCAEEAEAPHRLYGILPASAAFSSGAWLRLAVDEIRTIQSSGRTPLLVGGTGLYFKALTEGFADLPDIPDDVRQAARQLADEEGVKGLKQALLDKGDRHASEAHNDPQRLARALEVLSATGKPLSAWQRDNQMQPFLKPDMFRGLVLAPPRPWLHKRIALRAQMMLSQEGIEEVRALLALGLSPDLPAMRAIGVAEIAALLAGDCDREEAAERLTVATRQYAKRQETWFRNQMARWQRFDPSTKINVDTI